MGFIKNLISGIIGFLQGLFGKKSEYFLELDESNAAKPAPKAEPAKAEAAPKATAAKPAAADLNSTNGKAPAAPAVAAIAAAPAKAPAPVKAPAAPAPAPGPATFATDFLLYPSGNGRRRPGPSLNRFIDMAKQVKTSS